MPGVTQAYKTLALYYSINEKRAARSTTRTHSTTPDRLAATTRGVLASGFVAVRRDYDRTPGRCLAVLRAPLVSASGFRRGKLSQRR